MPIQIPENMQLRKEVILGLIKASTVFISYLSASALDKTHEAGNKTLSATHVINAFKEMGFPEEYATQLRREYNGEQQSSTHK
jgi:DNA polymerase epsilon subunit 3